MWEEASLMFIRLSLTWEPPVFYSLIRPPQETNHGAVLFFFLNWYFKVTDILYLNVKGGNLFQICVGGFWDLSAGCADWISSVWQTLETEWEAWFESWDLVSGSVPTRGPLKWNQKSIINLSLSSLTLRHTLSVPSGAQWINY